MEIKKIKELEERYPNITGSRYVKPITEETYNSSWVYQTSKNWEKHCNNEYSYIKELNNLMELDDLRDALIEIFSFKWLIRIFKRIKHFLIYILVGKNVNKKKRKEEWNQWKNQQTSWTPGNITKK
jgi:hypothetical protein